MTTPRLALRAARAAHDALYVARAHPRHLVLFGAVAGLLLAAVPLAVAAAALGGAALAGRVPLALAVGVAVIAGAWTGETRLAATGPGALAALAGRDVATRAILLEPVRVRRDGSATARVRLTGPMRIGGARTRWGRPEPMHERAGVPPGVYALGGELAVARSADGRAPPGARVGSELRLAGTIVPLEPTDDYQRRRGAFAALDVSRWAATGRARGGLPGVLDRARERAAAALGRGLDDGPAALLRGMVLGQDEAIEEPVREDFRRSGLAHLVAVSGQNVLLLSVLVLGFAAVLGVPLRLRLMAAAVLVALYVPLAGGGPSIQRAGVMGIAALVAALAGRPASRWYALGLAAAVTLTLNPRAAGDPGWQLSFAAVAGLLWLVPALQPRLARRLPAPVAEAAAMTVAATLATAPLLALHFEQVSLASLPANLLAAPAVAPVMWLGMLAVAAAQVAPGLAAVPVALCAPLLGYLSWVAERAAAFPLAAVPVHLGGPVGLAAAYAALVAGCALGVRGARVLRRRMPAPPLVPGPRLGLALAAAVAGALALAAVAAQSRATPRLRPGELVVSFLDVGQGDAVLLQERGVSVLFDTGPPRGPMLRRLTEAGVGRLDVLVLTHAEADHEGMALAVIRAHRPRLVLDGGAGWPSAVQRGLHAALAAVKGRLVPARAGQTIRLGTLALRILWPPAPRPGWRPDGNPNDRAVVALARVGSFDLLLTADAESNVTAPLDLPPVEVLKVAHHGSADPGLPALLERVRPSVAAISVGRHNTYGHPAPATLAALRGVPQLARTDRDGTVRVRVLGGRMMLVRGGAW